MHDMIVHDWFNVEVTFAFQSGHTKQSEQQFDSIYNPHCARPTLFCPEFCLLTAWNKFGSLRVSAIHCFSPIWLPNQNHYFLGALGTPVLPNLYITAKICNNIFWIGNHPPPPAGLHCLSNSLCLCLLAHFAPGCPACFSLGSSWQLIVLLSLVRRRQRLQRAQLTGRQINWE